MTNFRAFDFASLHPSFRMFDTLPRLQVAGKLREIAEVIEGGKLIIQSAYSMDAVHEGQLAHTTLVLDFRYMPREERSPLQRELDERRLTGKRESPLRDKLNEQWRNEAAAKRLIEKYGLQESEERIAKMLAERIADGDIGQFIEEFLKLRRGG